jgi:aminoglycoside 6'-N-acetyltransferase I
VRGDVSGEVQVRPLADGDVPEWCRLRHALWPETMLVDHENDLREYQASPATHRILVATGPDGSVLGFAEVRLRSHVDECLTSPVAFLEGCYVDLAHRRRGVGRQLVAAAEAWARVVGCREFGSDTSVDNAESRAAHRALRFLETPPAVTFHKVL